MNKHSKLHPPACNLLLMLTQEGSIDTQSMAGASSSNGGGRGSTGAYEFAVKNLRHPKAQWTSGTLRIDTRSDVPATSTASSHSPILTWHPDNNSGGDDFSLSVAFSAIQSERSSLQIVFETVRRIHRGSDSEVFCAPLYRARGEFGEDEEACNETDGRQRQSPSSSSFCL